MAVREPSMTDLNYLLQGIEDEPVSQERWLVLLDGNYFEWTQDWPRFYSYAAGGNACCRLVLSPE
jgi:hypothetical protein